MSNALQSEAGKGFRYVHYIVESRFLEPPGETQIGSRNREFEKSKVVSNYA